MTPVQAGSATPRASAVRTGESKEILRSPPSRADFRAGASSSSRRPARRRARARSCRPRARRPRSTRAPTPPTRSEAASSPRPPALPPPACPPNRSRVLRALRVLRVPRVPASPAAILVRLPFPSLSLGAPSSRAPPSTASPTRPGVTRRRARRGSPRGSQSRLALLGAFSRRRPLRRSATRSSSASGWFLARSTSDSYARIGVTCHARRFALLDQKLFDPRRRQQESARARRARDTRGTTSRAPSACRTTSSLAARALPGESTSRTKAGSRFARRSRPGATTAEDADERMFASSAARTTPSRPSDDDRFETMAGHGRNGDWTGVGTACADAARAT